MGPETSQRPAAAAAGAPGASHDTLNRGFGFRSALSLAFADISPIVALYAIFALGLFAAGPRFFWAFPIVLAGQMLVALVFGELASRWPYAGSVYQWARHARGTAWGWTAAWAYLWGLTLTLSTMAYAAAGFLLGVLDVVEPTRLQLAAVSLGIIGLGTAANMIGRQVLKVMIIASILCEIVGSVVLGIVLLVFHRVNPVSTLFEGLPDAEGGTVSTMLLAMAFVGWAFLGFESAGSIAEEVEEPERNVPKAIVFGLLLVGSIVMFSAVAVILAIPDLPAVLSAQSGDPVSATLTAQLGASIAKPLLIMFVIGFVSAFLAVQSAVSRAVYGMARDGALPGAEALAKLAGPERMPIRAIGLTAVVSGLFLLFAGSDLYNVLVNFSVLGPYIAFAVPVFAAALLRLSGRWVPGPFSLGRWGGIVTYAAAAWLAFEIVNVLWPRTQPGQPWYINWSMVISLVALGIVGVAVYASRRNRISGPVGERS
ncbi:amino acid permease [Nocardioides albidus]|uniref:Amino acid permease n=1 Tax=Nocardioides albidus TaxID=1517589 RepID=A0A5C4WM27_9ACTN|nr:amino acid permease [Nocardioides albidus]TNM48299.1 amino acid permease [Nocardioides albidus]